MASTESILQTAADNGTLESEEWPKALEYILDRLDEIVNDFPKPPSPPSDPLTPSAANPPQAPQPPNNLSSQTSETADKENAPPATPPRPPVPAFGTASSSSNTLPPEITTFYSTIRTQLSSNFPKHPPHTIQRLAELILQPKRHYRYLPSYLRALDRVVSVSSPTTVFPLPQAILPNPAGLLNGTTSPPHSTTGTSNLGSDESLGGALLTPIPWLQNRGSQSELVSESTEMVEGPNGAGRIETVTVMNGAGAMAAAEQAQQQQQQVQAQQQQQQIASSHPDGETLPYTGPVTQGELLRQEQEAGIVLSNPHSIPPNRVIAPEIEIGAGNVVDTVEEEEAPHARGPEVIGMEDTGPQKSGLLDIEGAVGRPSIERSSKSPQPPSASEKEGDEADTEVTEDKAGESKDEEMKDDDEAKEDVQPKDNDDDKKVDDTKAEDKDAEMKTDE